MKVLVTGGSGFLGSHVADALSERGHQVILFDRVESPWLRPDQAMIVGDILDGETLRAAMAGCDVVYHMAALADIGEAMGNPRTAISVNVMGTLSALETAVATGIKRFVFSSSIYVYSSQGSFYRTSKQACENLIHDFHDMYSLPYTILRYGSLYGPRANNGNFIRRVLEQALGERRINYGGTGREVREYIHILDAASASVDILAAEFENEIIHLTGQERMTSRDVMEMVAEIVGGGVVIETDERGWPGRYVQTPYSYTPKIGRKLIRHTYIDLGLGLLDYLEKLHNGGDPPSALVL